MHQFCAYHRNRISPWLVTQNGGSARDYLLGFAWSGATVMVQRASGLSVCLFIGALGVNFRICRCGRGGMIRSC